MASAGAHLLRRAAIRDSVRGVATTAEGPVDAKVATIVVGPTAKDRTAHQIVAASSIAPSAPDPAPIPVLDRGFLCRKFPSRHPATADSSC